MKIIAEQNSNTHVIARLKDFKKIYLNMLSSKWKTFLATIGLGFTACTSTLTLQNLIAQESKPSAADAGETAQSKISAASNWAHWRGPRMDGHAYQANLPEDWSTKGENVIWHKEEYASRGTPVVMNGKMYLTCRSFPESTKEGEKTVCFDPITGELIWESIHNVFLSDAPAERVSWNSPIADPETNRIYALGISGVFQCLDGDTGEVVWDHSMMEEYGMISPYGGRTNFATVFEDLVIVSAVMTGWGESAVPAHRYVAFDKSTGMAAWMFSTRPKPEDTTYSTPVFTVFNGQAAMVFGAGDGGLYALQPRTGKLIWKYQASPRGINTTPLVDENGIVYCGHAEQNESDRTILGALFAVDGKMTGEIPEAELVWKIPKMTVSRCAPVKNGNQLYVVDDGGRFFSIDATTGKEIESKKLGRSMFGSILFGDDKLYIAENSGLVYILKPTADGIEQLSKVRVNEGEFFGSPIAYASRIYLPTNTGLFCVGDKDAEPSYVEMPPAPVETPVAKDQAIAHIQLAPVELMLRPKQKVTMQVRGYNKIGQFVKLVDGADVKIDGPGLFVDGVYVAPQVDEATAVMITATSNGMTSTARARIIPDLPLNANFNDSKVPLPWIGAAYRHKPAEFEGEKVLVKISTIPKGTRSQAWIASPDLHDYTVQADFYATDKRADMTTDRLPDMGLVAQRYTLDLKGSQELQIRSWTPRLENRFAKTMKFDWKAKTWYTMKFQSETVGEAATLRGKVWLRGEAEPADWQIEATDAVGNLQGSPGLFGNSGDAEFYIDNVTVSKN